MTDEELIKKKPAKRRSSERSSRSSSKNIFPTLGHIVLSNGLRVEIPELPQNISQLTTYDHMRIALEYAALAICSLNRLGSHFTPRLADNFNLAPIRLNLEDLLNHLHYAIQDYNPKKGVS
jgi:hypothetical protein